jgi:hypothetical protein
VRILSGCSAGCPRRTQRPGKRAPEADERDRRGDPPAGGGEIRRPESAYRRAPTARRPDHHRTGAAAQRTPARPHAEGQGALCLALRPATTRLHEPLQAGKLALRSLARRIRALNDELAELDQQLEQLVTTAAPRTVQLFGVGTTQSASQLLITAGQNIDRLHSEAAFAKICGAAPIQASSGRTTRHRLDFGGDRQANRALHMIAVCRLRYCQRTRAYATKRTAEGLSRREILRCLKRYIARQTYHTLRSDLEALNRT